MTRPLLPFAERRSAMSFTIRTDLRSFERSDETESGLAAQARRKAEHDLALAHCAGSRLPAARDSALEQLTRIGLMVPDGDRHHGAKSGRVENEEGIVGDTEHDIVGVLILDHDIDELGGRCAVERPANDCREGPQGFGIRQDGCVGRHRILHSCGGALVERDAAAFLSVAPARSLTPGAN